MRIRIGVRGGGQIAQVGGQGVQTRVLAVTGMPILALGAVFVVREEGNKLVGPKVPLFSRMGMWSALLAFARPWFFMLGGIPLMIGLLRDQGVQWNMVVFGSVLLALWFGIMKLGRSSDQQRYEQLLLGLASGVAALPEWLDKHGRDETLAVIEDRFNRFVGREKRELQQIIEARQGDGRVLALAFALARYGAQSDPTRAALAKAALSWAREALPLGELERVALDDQGRLRVMGLTDGAGDAALMLQGRRAFVNPAGGAFRASVLLCSDQGMEFGTRDDKEVAEAVRAIDEGVSPKQAIGDGYQPVPYSAVQKLEVHPKGSDVVVHYQEEGKDTTITYGAADSEQREQVIAHLTEALGARFVTAKREASKVGTIVMTALGLGVAFLVARQSWDSNIARVLVVGAVGWLLWRLLQRFRSPIMVTYLERMRGHSQAPQASM